MKTSKLVVFLFFLGIFTKPVFSTVTAKEAPKIQSPIVVASEIESVIVYLQGAEIVRTVAIPVESGLNIFSFEQLSPDIDENSIQISGLGNATILSINYGVNHLSKPMNIEK